MGISSTQKSSSRGRSLMPKRCSDVALYNVHVTMIGSPTKASPLSAAATTKMGSRCDATSSRAIVSGSFEPPVVSGMTCTESGASVSNAPFFP